MDSRWKRIAAVLDQVLEAPTKERARLLHELAGADAGIHAEVVRLLEAADRDDGVLDRDAGDYFGSFFEAALTQGEETLAADQAPQSVGPWRVLREIGRGGMGVVYLAERSDGDFEQRAALKLLKRGLDTEAIIERFRQERRILARLTHPAIARLIDGGVATDGRPYLAMELAEGEPITTWCDRRRSPLEQRLRLFQSICDAVHYAHANLVVHRDLKPSNILVTEEGDLKLLDFGIAKLLSEEGEGEATEWTRMGVRAMTPEYAAPEQVRGDPVSTATDIYALGLILYELLIGRRPYEVKGQSRKELEHQILETEPMWPSIAVARGLADDKPGRAADAATERGLTAASLRRALAGDLDAIVMKTLRNEPRERYASAQGLAEDVGRYLARQPITARPEGRLYRAGKFVRRHRLGVVMSAVVTLTLTGGLAVATWQARARALEARRAEVVKDFLVGIFQEADPVQARGEDLTVRELLDRGADQVRLELADEPELRGELLTVLGGIYAELSATDRASELTDEALGIHERLFGAGDRRVATNLRQQAALALARGEVEAAEPLARRALAAHRDELGAEHPEVAEDLDVLVITLAQAGRDAEALPLARDSLAIRRAAWDGEHRLVGDSLNNLAVLLRRQGELDEAAAVYAETVELRRRLLGPQHPHYALALHNFAALENVRGRYASAAALQEEALESFERLYGPDHPLTLAANNNRAKILVGLADFDAAEAALRGVLEAWRRTQGEDHPNALTTTAGLAQVHRARGDLESAERLLRDVERRWNEVLGEDHVDGARIRRELGAVLAERGRYPEAEALLSEALGSLRSAHGDRHLEVATALHESGLLALDRGDLGAAESALAGAWRQRRDLAGDGHPDTIATRLAMASVLAARGQVEEAERGFREALSKLRETLPGGHPAIAEAALGLGRTLLDAQDAGAAEEFLREAFSIRRDMLGQAHWQTAEAGLWLGACLARLDRAAEATTVLSQSLTVLETERGSDHELTRRARAELQALGSL